MLNMKQPAHSASVDEKGKAINPLVWRPQLSTFTHRVMNHECELLDAPTDTLLCERCISDQKKEKSGGCRVYSKPIKRTILKCFTGTIYVHSKNPSLDLF